MRPILHNDLLYRTTEFWYYVHNTLTLSLNYIQGVNYYDIVEEYDIRAFGIPLTELAFSRQDDTKIPLAERKIIIFEQQQLALSQFCLFFRIRLEFLRCKCNTTL